MEEGGDFGCCDHLPLKNHRSRMKEAENRTIRQMKMMAITSFLLTIAFQGAR